MVKIVKEKEELISQTEMMMQQKSIYSDTYKPQFISEMNEEQLEAYSKWMEARNNKDFETADLYRKKLVELNIL